MSVLTELRNMSPERSLKLAEAKYVAERQAHRLRRLLDLDRVPRLPTEAIEGLPRVRVHDVPGMKGSGLSGWHIPSRTWQIYLNAEDDQRRRRFTLLHEYKHIIDRPFVGQLVGYGAFSSEDQAELLCDHFASCALMPRPLVKWEWIHGTQSVPELASAFGVTPAAMRVRLSKLGLTVNDKPRSRHGDTNLSNQFAALASAFK